MEYAIEASQLRKVYGDHVALDGLDLGVPRGTVYGLLGPNGAGKTTTVNLLTTLQRPTSGSATVLGYDIATQGRDVRSVIGLTGQYAAVDEHLTGRENLILISELLGAGRRQARSRADELLERFALTDAASRRSGQYSGGMRRRLDLAASLVGSPEVVFLDEPTTGLDPRSRLQLWDVVRDLVRNGTTVLLTTQYLEEADELADQILVIDSGRAVAAGTAAELKQRIGGHTIAASFPDAASVLDVLSSLERAGRSADVDADTDRIVVRVPSTDDVFDTLQLIRSTTGDIADIEVAAPTLDDVFLTLTGAGADDLHT